MAWWCSASTMARCLGGCGSAVDMEEVANGDGLDMMSWMMFKSAGKVGIQFFRKPLFQIF